MENGNGEGNGRSSSLKPCRRNQVLLSLKGPQCIIYNQDEGPVSGSSTVVVRSPKGFPSSSSLLSDQTAQLSKK